RLDERLARRAEGVVGQAGDADVHAVAAVSHGRERRPAVRADELHAGADTGADALQQRGPVVADDAAEEDTLRSRLRDLGRNRRVVRGLRVPDLVADDLDVELLRGEQERLGDALAVRLVV